MRNRILIYSLVVILTLLSACAADDRNAPTGKEVPKAVEASPRDMSQAEWQKEWEKTLMAARREGKISAVIWHAPEVRDPVHQAFKAKYGIEMEIISGGARELAEKVLREVRGGINLEDVFIAGTGPPFTVLKPAGLLDDVEPDLIFPEVKDPKAWYEGKLPFQDKDKKILSFIAAPAGTAWINTDMVKKEELKSATDYLNPRWKGKIVMIDPSITGFSHVMMSAIAVGPLGYDYLRAFAKQEPLIINDRRLVSEWVARGKYPIGMGVTLETMSAFVKLGLPVEEVSVPEGRLVTEGGGTVVLLKNAPHPNARKVFTNWLLSKEGQTVWSKGDFKNSARIDVPTDHLSALDIRQPGVSYTNTMSEEWNATRPDRAKTISGIFAPLLK